MAAAGLALENAQLKAEVAALKRQGASGATPGAAVASRGDVCRGDGHESPLRLPTREEKEFLSEARIAVTESLGEDLRKCCAELLKDDPTMTNAVLVRQAHSTLITESTLEKADQHILKTDESGRP